MLDSITPAEPRVGVLLGLVVLLLSPGLLAGEASPCPRVHFFQPDAGATADVAALTVTEDGRLCAAAADPERRTEEMRGQEGTATDVSPGKAFLYSALVPGAGQRLLGQERWAPYMAMEVWAWIQFFLRRDRGATLSQRYRDLAWEVARRVSVGPRTDGDFGYYESLTRFNSSGAVDRDPLAAGVQPETDPETFNGSLWQLAMDIFFPPEAEETPSPGSPPYEQALEFYLDRSISPRLAWNWSDNSLQRSVYTDLIRESDEAFRSSTTMVGLILANHFVSAIDALVSARLRDMGRDPEVLNLQPMPLGPRGRWGVWIQIRH